MADLDKKRTSHNRQAKGVSRERERDRGVRWEEREEKGICYQASQDLCQMAASRKSNNSSNCRYSRVCACAFVYVFNTDSSVDMCLHIRVSLEHNKVFKLYLRRNYCRLVLIARKER